MNNIMNNINYLDDTNNNSKLILTDEQIIELKRQEIENNRQEKVSNFIKKESELLNQRIYQLNDVFDKELLNLEYEYKRRLVEKKKQAQNLKKKHKIEINNHNLFWNSIGGQLAQIRKYRKIIPKKLQPKKVLPKTYYAIQGTPRWNSSTLL